jgi:oligopeptide/dipeptide ABC transporter ATP-binding protein
MKAEFGMAIMLITHAMGVVAETAQRVAVMYAGRVVEEAPVEELFANPLHPYTQGLIRSIPRLDTTSGRRRRLEAISGTVPSLLSIRRPAAASRRAARLPASLAPRRCRRCGRSKATTRSHARSINRTRRGPMSEPLLRVRNLVKNFPVQAAGSPARASRCTRSTRQLRD